MVAHEYPKELQKTMTIKKVGVTGAAGNIGQTLRAGLDDRYELTLFDANPIDQEADDWPCVVIDLADCNAVKGRFNGLDAIIHLAADADPAAPWEKVLQHNILPTAYVFQEAARAGLRKIVLASTNHVQHGYSQKETIDNLDAPYYENHGLVSLKDPTHPDSLYAVSKLFGENLGKYYSGQFDIQFVGLRIGWTTPDNDPSKVMGTKHESYMRAVFLSHQDCAEAFTRALEVDAKYVVAYAVSNNERGVFDLKETGELLGFYPKDNVETFI